jgi:hypothetical protein
VRELELAADAVFLEAGHEPELREEGKPTAYAISAQRVFRVDRRAPAVVPFGMAHRAVEIAPVALGRAALFDGQGRLAAHAALLADGRLVSS